VQIKRQADGWYVCLGTEAPKPPSLPETGQVVGIDLGISSFAALTTGEKVAGPRARLKAELGIAQLQRAVARADRGSSFLAKDVHDQAWGQFERILTDKAEEAGRQLVHVDPRGSSQDALAAG